jgi:hypothetical protein
MEFVEEKVFLLPTKISVLFTENVQYNPSTSFTVNNKICFLQRYGRKVCVIFDNESWKIVWIARYVPRIMDFKPAIQTNLSNFFNDKIRGKKNKKKKNVVILVLDISD